MGGAPDELAGARVAHGVARVGRRRLHQRHLVQHLRGEHCGLCQSVRDIWAVKQLTACNDCTAQLDHALLMEPYLASHSRSKRHLTVVTAYHSSCIQPMRPHHQGMHRPYSAVPAFTKLFEPAIRMCITSTGRPAWQAHGQHHSSCPKP